MRENIFSHYSPVTVWQTKIKKPESPAKTEERVLNASTLQYKLINYY